MHIRRYLRLLLTLATLLSATAVTPGTNVQAQDSTQEIPTGVRRIGTLQSRIVRIDGREETLDVGVAVLDSGIDTDHPDLHVTGGTDCATTSAADATIDDSDGHGTFIAGIIAARDNTIGVVGVAPGVRLYSVRVFGPGAPWPGAAICGLNWVADNADIIDVAVMSFGSSDEKQDFSQDRCDGPAELDPLHTAVCRAVNAGVTLVAAAGPTAKEKGKDVRHVVPAGYPEVITVSAMTDYDGLSGGKSGWRFMERIGSCLVTTINHPDDGDDTFADGSNYGTGVELTGPGMCIKSTKQDGTYTHDSGTSFAAPHVAGAAALYKAIHPCATPQDVRAALIAAGERNWNVADPLDDPDGVQEPLVSVAGLERAPGPTLSALPTRISPIQAVAPGTPMEIVVTIQNTSPGDWPAGDRFTLAHVNGPTLGLAESQPLPQAIPRWREVSWRLPITAPSTPGVYQSTWQMACEGGTFGRSITIILVVSPANSSLDLREQLTALVAGAGNQLSEQFDQAWKQAQAEIERRIREEIQRQIREALAPVCGTPVGGVVIAGSAVWWRRRRRST